MSPAGKIGLRGVWAGLLALFFAGGIFCIWLSFQGYATWRGLGDGIARDGSLESLTPQAHGSLVWPVRLFGLFGLSLAGVMLARREGSLRALRGMLAFPGQFLRTTWDDLRAFLRQMRPTPAAAREWLPVGAILLASVLLRLPYLDRPMLHDEAYTVETWASGSLRYALEDYHLPNNHIFHTLQVQLVFNTLGDRPWMIRLPAFVASALLVPAGYGLARRWFGRAAALVAAGLIGAAPIHSFYATNARGYPLFMLLTLVVFWLAARALREKNRVDWLLLIVCAGLGFWTVPMMLYPFGGVCLWIFLSALCDRQAVRAYGGRWGLLKHLFVAGAATGALALLLYLPVLVKGGPEALFGNQFVASMAPGDFWPTLWHARLPEVWEEWTRGWGAPGGLLLVAGVVASLVMFRRSPAYRFHPLWAIALWVVPLMLWQRPNAWARVWSYLYPLGYLWAAAGWTALADRVSSIRFRRTIKATTGVLVALGFVLNGAMLLRECPGLVCPPGEEERAVAFLAPQLTETDLVLVESPSDAPVWYYFRQYGLSHDRFRKDLPFYRAFLLLRTQEGQTAEGLIAYRGPEIVFFDLATTREVARYGGLTVLEVQAFPDRVREAFGLN